MDIYNNLKGDKHGNRKSSKKSRVQKWY
jgi:hypothetical protein